jgi:hypothetical protein
MGIYCERKRDSIKRKSNLKKKACLGLFKNFLGYHVLLTGNPFGV